MKIKEVESIKIEKIYELTESELEDIRCEEREYGSRKTKEYICFCWDNYTYQKNLGGMLRFLKILFPFLTDQTSYIENRYNLSFWDWLKKNR